MSHDVVRISPAAAGVQLDLRVIPRSSRSAIDGVRDGRLLIRVTAAPVDSAANDAVIRLLSDALQVPRRAVSIVAGATGRNKTAEVKNQTAAGITAILERLLSGVKP